jgi:hypothetical protein
MTRAKRSVGEPDHDDLIEDDDEHLAQLERGPSAPEPTEPLIASEDTWIARPDLGPSFTTFIPAGHPIPANLAGHIDG